MECYTYLRNVTDLLFDEKTPYERRFGQPFKGPIIPFGSLVEYHPITAKDQSRIHQFGKKVLPWLFLKYALYAGGIWKGDVLVADLEELETMDASEIFSKRFKAKEGIFPKQGKIYFPIADGRIKTFGGDQDLKTSTLVPPSTNSRKESRWLFWRIKGFTTSRLTSGCRWSTKWFSVHVRKLHIPPSRWTPSQTLLAEKGVHSLFHWNTLTYPELLVRISMSSKRSASMIIGISMDLETCLILGQVSHNLLYWKKNLLTEICGPGRD